MLLATMVIGALLTTPAQEGGLREVTLKDGSTNQKVQINGSLGVATTIQLPDDWVGQPICGDCAFGTAESTGQLWRVALQEVTRTLVVRPIVVPSHERPPSEYLTNLQMTLASGITLTFFVQLVPKANADFSVTLRLPEGATSKERVSTLEKELTARFATRLKEATAAAALDNLMTPVVCRDIENKVQRSDGMVVRLSQLCHVGTYLYVTFEVENRQRKALELGSATLTDPDQNSSDMQRFEKSVLQFNETTRGIAAFSTIQPGTQHREYGLVVAEEGGQDRVVEWTNLHFGSWF